MKTMKNAASAVAQVVISAALMFLLYRVILETLGVEALGIWSVVLATASASRIGELGMSTGVTRFVAKYRALGDDAKVSAVLQTGAISVGVLLLLVIVPAFLFLPMAFVHLFPAERLDDATNLLPFLMGSLVLSAVAGIFQSGLEGCQKYTQKAVLVSVGNLFFVIAGVLFAPRYGLQGLAWAQIGQGLFLVLGGWLLLKQLVSGMPMIPLHWRKETFREMLCYGSQVQLASLAMMLFDPLTKILLSKFGGLSATGYFEMANQLVAKVKMLVVAANQVIVPRVAELNEEQKSIDMRAMYRSNLGMLFLVVPVTMGLLVGWTPVVSEIWIGHHEPVFVLFAVIWACSWGINIFAGPAYFSNQGRGALKWNTLAHIMIGLTNVLFGFLLGRLFGGVGVVVGAGLALVCGSFLVVYGFQRDLAIPWKTLPYKGVSASILATGLSAISAQYCYSLLEFAPSLVRLGVPLLVPLPILALVLWYHPLIVSGRSQALSLYRRNHAADLVVSSSGVIPNESARSSTVKNSDA